MHIVFWFLYKMLVFTALIIIIYNFYVFFDLRLSIFFYVFLVFTSLFFKLSPSLNYYYYLFNDFNFYYFSLYLHALFLYVFIFSTLFNFMQNFWFHK